MYEMTLPNRLKSLLPLLQKRIDSYIYIAEKNLTPFPPAFRCSNEFVKIANAIPKSQSNPVPRYQLGVTPDDFVLCLVSRAIPEKGWEEAINAVIFANANSTRSIHLLLIGNGPEFDRLRPNIKLHYIHFLGSRPHIVDYFATSDIGLLPSRFRGESFPLALIECLGAGKPILASNIGEIEQMLRAEDGLAGEVFDLEDWTIPVQRLGELIIKVAEDREHYHCMLNRVPHVVAKFDPLAMVNDYEAVYQRCQAKRARMTKGLAGEG
jgi:glycosyltransferase involved in cell wall biosynthesis